MQLLIQQAKIVDPRSEHHNQTADLLIEDGIITAIGTNIEAKNAKIITDHNLHVSTGWTDIFADYREPGYEHKETIATGLAAAAAGGYTDVLTVPNTYPVVSTKSIVQYLLQTAGGNVVNLHPCGSATQNAEGKTLAEMMDMRANGAIAFTDGWKPIQNAGLMQKALEYIKAFNGILLQMPVDDALAEGGLMHEGPVSTRLGMAGIPALAETLMVHRDIELLRYTGSRLHITGISVAESVEKIRAAKKEGLQVTCSVTPYHLALTDDALITYKSVYKVSPPLRNEADRQALIAGLKDGTIDCIASHHRPHEWDAKTKEFEYAADGMNVQEMAFSIVYNAIGTQVPLHTIIHALSTAPRAIFGLPALGIAKGGKACLTLFSPDDSTIYTDDTIKSLSRNNPFIDKKMKGRVLGIINNDNFVSNI
jgi:dihydroorotase